jgi:hypothetical protein
MNLLNLKRVFRAIEGYGAQNAAGKWSGLGRQALVFLIQQHHLTHAVRTEIEDIPGRKVGVAAAAPSYLKASSFPLSPFNPIPGNCSIGLHSTGFSSHSNRFAIPVSNNDTMHRFLRKSHPHIF